MIDLEDAIRFTVESAKTESSMSGSDCFKSVEALTLSCDPVARGVWAAANNRAALRLYAETCVYQATPEGIQAELAELAAAGFVPSCGCRGGACNLPAKAVTS
jgi:hypothetical protein